MKGKIKTSGVFYVDCADCTAYFFDEANSWDDMKDSLIKNGWLCSFVDLEFVWRCGECATNTKRCVSGGYSTHIQDGYVGIAGNG